jgi:NADH:ubiquinone oxidoreductase subunit C
VLLVGDVHLGIAPADAEQDLLRFLRDEQGLEFIHLADLTAIDRSELPARQRLRPGSQPRFASIYHLYSIPHRRRIRLTVPAQGPDEKPAVPSL